jgi:type IV pilus assembly protein PilN
MPRINLLPWREAQRIEKQRQFTVMAFGAVILSALAVIFVHIQFSSMIESQNIRNRFLNDSIASVEKEIAEIKTLKADKKALLARMEVIQTLQRSRPGIVHLFEELATTTPNGVYLKTAARKGSSINLTGIANSNDSVSKFMRRLDSSPWLANPELKVIEGDPKTKGSRFVMQVTQETPEVESTETDKKAVKKKKKTRR